MTQLILFVSPLQREALPMCALHLFGYEIEHTCTRDTGLDANALIAPSGRLQQTGLLFLWALRELSQLS